MILSLDWLNQFVNLKDIEINHLTRVITQCICPVICCKEVDLTEDLNNYATARSSPDFTKERITDVILVVEPRFRSDLLGHYGFARELSAIFNLPMKSLRLLQVDDFVSQNLRKQKNVWNVAFLCGDFEGLILSQSILKRLIACGISWKEKTDYQLLCEYVMLELGVPLSSALINTDDEIIIEEHVEAYSEMDVSHLAFNDIVVTDLGFNDHSPKINIKTAEVVFYSVIFNPTAVRRFAAISKTNNSATKRNSNYLNSFCALIAIERLLYLLKRHSKKCIYTTYTLKNPRKEPALEYIVTKNMAVELYGEDDIWGHCEHIFDKLGFVKFKKSTDELVLIVPYWRNPIDLNHHTSFIRELIRICGFRNEKNISDEFSEKKELFHSIPVKDCLRKELCKLAIKEIYLRPFNKNESTLNLRSELGPNLVNCLIRKGIKNAYEIGRVFLTEETVKEHEHICIAGEIQSLKAILKEILKAMEMSLKIQIDVYDNRMYDVADNIEIGRISHYKNYMYIEICISKYLGMYL